MSSDAEDSDASSSNESEDINVTGLVATRSRRGNAGNLYETIRAHLDDEEVQKLLLAEEEVDDAEDYEGTDEDDEDADAIDSSSDEEDQGPPQEGEAEDLTGEKELLRKERAENTKKRKAQAAKLTVPGWQKTLKKVKLAGDATADDSSTAGERLKKKKTERYDWTQSAQEGPTRQSIRSSAIANREITHANLEESAKRARKQKATLTETLKQKSNKRVELSVEQRLEKCKRIEKETAKELGRFEREEAERVRLREEALLAKRRRVFDGPVIRTVTTSGYYENGKLKVKRLLHGSQNVDEIFQAQRDADAAKAALLAQQQEEQAAVEREKLAAAQASSEALEQHNPLQDVSVMAQDGDKPEPAHSILSANGEQGEAVVPTAVLGNDQQSAVNTTQHGSAAAPTANDISIADSRATYVLEMTTPAGQQAPTAALNGSSQGPITGMTALGSRPAWPPGSQTFNLAPAAEEPPPTIREQAQRSLVTLDAFESLEGLSTKRSKTGSGIEPTPVAQILMPDSYPTFTDEQVAYLKKARKQKQESMTKPTCALTSWPGKYLDPKTGVVFADVAAYKMLQRMIAGGCAWNPMLECWTGPAYGQIGRPAKGVPEGFVRPVAVASAEK